MKLTLRILLGFLFTLLLVLVFVLTPLANPVWRWLANTFVEPLTVSKIEGDIRRGLTISGIQWHTKTETATLDSFAFSPKWACLIDKTVCIDTIRVNGIHVATFSADESSASAPSEPLDRIALPLGINITNILVTDVNLATPGANVKLEKFTTSIIADERIRIIEPMLSNLAVTIPSSEESPPDSSPATGFQLAYTPPQLPIIEVPIDIEVSQFAISPLVIEQAQTPHHINTIAFDRFTFERSTINIDQLAVDDELITLTLNGSVQLTQDYPIELSLQGEGEIPHLAKQQAAHVAISGSLGDIAINIDTTGYINSQTSVSGELLTPSLPLNANANWQAFGIEGETPIEVLAGQIQLNGMMGNYSITADAGVIQTDIGKAKLNLLAQVNDSSAEIKTAVLSALEGEIATQGVVYFDDSISWIGKTQLDAINTAQFNRDIPSPLNGALNSQLRLTNQGVDVNLSGIDLHADYLENPLVVTGQALYSASSDIVVATLDITHADNQVSTVTQLFNQRYLKSTADVNLTSLSSITTDISGTMTGQIVAEGEWHNPRFDIQLNGNDITVAQSLNKRASEQGPMSFNVGLKGDIEQHDSQVTLQAKDFASNLKIAGGLHDRVWGGRISHGDTRVFQSNWHLDKPAEVTLNLDSLASSLGEHCWKEAAQGAFCIGQTSYSDGVAKWNFDASHIPIGTWIHKLLPDTVKRQSLSELTVNSSGNYHEGHPLTAEFEIDISPASWFVGPDEGIEIGIEEFHGKASIKGDELFHRFTLASPQLGKVELNGKLQNITQSPTIDSQLTLAGIDLSPLNALSDTLEQLEGRIQGQIQIANQLSQPSLKGELKLHNGRIESPALPTQINNWEQVFLFNGTSADFEGQFTLGEGLGGLDGQLDWSETPSLRLHLTGNEFAFRQKDVRIKLSPDLTAHINPEAVSVTGDITIPWARIEIEGLPETAVSPSSDVHLRGEPPSEDPLRMIDANVNVIIDEKQLGEVKLDAFGLTANLQGALKVATQPAITAYGDLSLNDGRYEAYGQNLIIRTGEIQFNGPVAQPVLLVEAIRDPNDTEDDVIAGVRIDGPATRPNVGLFSEPTMDQGANLAYLLNGSAGIGGGGGEMNQEAYAGILLGLGLSNTESITGKVGEAIGIDDFSLSTSGQGADTKVQVSGKIANNLTVRYGVGVFNSNDASAPEVALRYQLSDNLYIEAIQGLYQALDMYYQFSLGKQEDQTGK